MPRRRFNVMDINEIITDLKKGFYYNFTIKPEDEDEQSYFKPGIKKDTWGVVAYCFTGQIITDRLLHRLETRFNPIVIKTEKHQALKLFEEG
jgi:hypothetical protein